MDTQNTKQKALDDFTARLLQSSLKDHIARIVLFGSVLDGEDQPESDVDVLVFGTDRLRELSEACAAASFETAMQSGRCQGHAGTGEGIYRFPGGTVAGSWELKKREQ